MSVTQKHRPIAIGTPLGDDVLLLKNCEIREELGHPFEIEMELRSLTRKIDFDKIIGQNVTIRVERPDGKTRYFNAYINSFRQDREMRPDKRDDDNFACYRATAVPWLWFLTQTADCRIFQKSTIPEIIQKVFKDHGFTDFKKALTGNYDKKEYVVQYRESDFNFVSRLMEQEGIYYYFEHANGVHTMVLIDAASGHKAYPGYRKISYRQLKAPGDPEHVRDWSTEAEVKSGVYSLNDFDFKVPGKGLRSKKAITRKHAVAESEVYDYPGKYVENGQGQRYSQIRIEELQCRHQRSFGHSDSYGISVGNVFELSEYPRRDQNRAYLIASATYRLQADSFFDQGGSMGGDQELYSCDFTCIDADEQFRPERVSEKPLIRGPQTAIVTGPKGEEIHTDEYGRVRVQFHWDREGAADENSSCWIRVAQIWAGAKWGAMYIPRIGQEVIVEFLEGDPDQPIITGRVYNGKAMPPYGLPSEKTKSTIKSNSSKGGGGFNEIRFEDKKDQEQIFIHGQKDEDVRIENDSKEWIGHDRHMIVKNNQLENVKVNKHYLVNGDRFGQVDGDDHFIVKGNRMRKVDGNDSREITGDLKEKVTGETNLKVEGNHNEKTGMTISLDAGQNIQEKAGMNHALDAGMNIHLKGGVNVVVEAGVQLTLKAAASFITIGPAGVAVSGVPLVLVNSGGAAGSGGGSSPKAPAPPDQPTPPEQAKEADKDKAGKVDKAKKAKVEKQKKTKLASKSKAKEYKSPKAKSRKKAAEKSSPFVSNKGDGQSKAGSPVN